MRNVDWLGSPGRLAALSGLGWGLIAFLLGERAFPRVIAAGVLASPLIGIAVRSWSAPLRHQPRWAQRLGSLVSLYAAGSCFAIVMGLSELMFSSRHAVVETLLQYVFAVAWGLTMGGFGLLLWPLAYWNHRLIWAAED